MNQYHMKLLPEYFEYIKIGTKRIELRLNDKKRQNIKIGDIIVFENLIDIPEFIKTRVKNIYFYDNFSSIIENFDIKLLADTSVSKEKLLNDINEIYSIDKQKKYGVIGIEIELI